MNVHELTKSALDHGWEAAPSPDGDDHGMIRFAAVLSETMRLTVEVFIDTNEDEVYGASPSTIHFGTHTAEPLAGAKPTSPLWDFSYADYEVISLEDKDVKEILSSTPRSVRKRFHHSIMGILI